MSKNFNISNENGDNQWISISDLMSVLMMIFLFIAISYMMDVVKEKDKIKEVAIAYNTLQTELYEDLVVEFEKDINIWNAEIDKETLSIKFNAPEVLFNSGSSVLKKDFKKILNNFFPRYIKILTKEQYINDIVEVRIEGHTSSEWSVNVSKDKGYFLNMQLSQDRTRKVLKHVLTDKKLDKKEWVRNRLTANGLSSSKLIFKNNIEDKEKSRRVEFRVRTNAESRMIKILTTN